MTGEGAGGPEEDDTKVGQRWLGREARFCGGSGQGGRRTEKKSGRQWCAGPLLVGRKAQRRRGRGIAAGLKASRASWPPCMQGRAAQLGARRHVAWGPAAKPRRRP
jgi:hypothetical protein